MKLFARTVGGLVACFFISNAWAWNTGTFDESADGGNKLRNSVDNCRGVYVIRLNSTPYYIGMSNSGIRDRLLAHISGRGSQRVAEVLGKNNKLEYEWMCLDNPEQAEAVLIKELGTYPVGNLRRETDPKDRFPVEEDKK